MSPAVGPIWPFCSVAWLADGLWRVLLALTLALDRGLLAGRGWRAGVVGGRCLGVFAGPAVSWRGVSVAEALD